MREGKEKLRLKITEAILKVCYISLNPDMLVADNEALKQVLHCTPFGESILKASVLQKDLTLLWQITSSMVKFPARLWLD